MEKVSPESLKDLILIAAEFDNVERRKEVELVLGDYMTGAIMERSGVEFEEALQAITQPPNIPSINILSIHSSISISHQYPSNTISMGYSYILKMTTYKTVGW